MTKTKKEMNNAAKEPETEISAQTAEIENRDASDAETAPKSEAEQLADKLNEEKSNYIRLYADFDNYRKRTGEQFFKIRQDGIAQAVEAIFPVLDSIDRALKCVDEASVEGVLLIKKQLYSALEALGVEEIGECDIAFDPNIHHAIQRVEDDGNSGKVVEVYQKGYKFKDRVIRCAMVKVAE